jgi:hypothetical protein
VVVLTRAGLVGVVGLALVVATLGPMTIATVTGRPLFVDCGGLAPAVCDEVWRQRAQGDPTTGRIVMVRVEPLMALSYPQCSAVSISRWWIVPLFGGTYSSPLC